MDEAGVQLLFLDPGRHRKEYLYVVTATKPPALTTFCTLRCIEASTGKELWNRPKVGKYHASLLRTGDSKLLLLEEAGTLVLLDPNPKEYKELARSKICGNTWAHPALADGRFYIRDTARSHLRAFKLMGRVVRRRRLSRLYGRMVPATSCEGTSNVGRE